MAIVNGSIESLSSPDRFDLVNQGIGWEIVDKSNHRIVSLHLDEGEARQAYDALTARGGSAR